MMLVYGKAAGFCMVNIFRIEGYQIAGFLLKFLDALLDTGSSQPSSENPVQRRRSNNFQIEEI